MIRRPVGLRRFLRPAVVGWALTGAGALILIAVSALKDPAVAGESARVVATVAFAAAQTGLVIVAFTVFQQLYARAERAARRKRRSGGLR